MGVPSHYDTFQVLLLQLADKGRGEALLGDSFGQARVAAEPFLVGDSYPTTYFELPLIGEPFLDLTVLYDELPPGTRVPSNAAEGTEALFDWFVREKHPHDGVNFGFELDTSKPELPRAAVHFQPRRRLDLVRPFFEVMGNPRDADLYLDLDARMPEGWKLSFFGLFRGRPDAPLRVCGYLGHDELLACADEPGRIGRVFDTIGFDAYDDALLDDLSRLMAAAPGNVDFQLDLYPDGSLGDIFAVDVQLEIEKPEAVLASFEDGPSARVMGFLEQWGVSDERWRRTPQAAFARALPVLRDDGTFGRFGFSLMPQWVKARWRAGERQPSKLYYCGTGSLLDTDREGQA